MRKLVSHGLVNPDAGTCVTTGDVHWVSGAALGTPGARAVGRNTLRTPFIWQQDLDVIKAFRITERMHLEYRAEIFNLFNRENFGLVFPTTPTAASFGDVLNTPAPATLGSHPLFLDFGQTEAVGRNMRMGVEAELVGRIPRLVSSSGVLPQEFPREVPLRRHYHRQPLNHSVGLQSQF